MLDVIKKLKVILGPRGYSIDPSDIAAHVEDWRGKYKGHSSFLALPSSTAELSSVLTTCHAAGIPVVPQGGNTGLVGGQIPLDGEIVLDTSRLSKIRAVDRDNATLTVEAGVTLQVARETADDIGLILALSMASEGSCTIGGVVSTNAGGINVLRYGMAREQVLGIEVVLADGRVMDMLRTLRKDNAGYDLKQLFIGAEGTLGVVSAVALRLFPKPVEIATALLAVPNLKAALAILTRAQTVTGGQLDAFEVVPDNGMELVLNYVPDTKRAFAERSSWYVLCQSAGAAGVGALLEEALAAVLEDQLATDAVIAGSESQRAALWKLRESVSEAERQVGPSLKHDISVPVMAVSDFVAKASEALTALAPDLMAIPFGHLGDGNIHYNVIAANRQNAHTVNERSDEVTRLVHDVVREFGGSFSAEHGIGVMKRDELMRYRSEPEIEAMRCIKRVFDPKNIMNPNKLLLV